MSTGFQTAYTEASALLRRSVREGWSIERSWAERVSRQRRAAMLDSAEALADYLVAEWSFWCGKAPTETECEEIARMAAAIWRSRQVPEPDATDATPPRDGGMAVEGEAA